MTTLDQVVAYLDSNLKTSSIADYPGAVNGLQLANEGSVTRVAAAVDASLPVVEAAISAGADLLVVHHGMFWQGVRPFTGSFRRKIKIALDANLAIYSSHLPLDVHPEWGNNIQLARAIGMLDAVPFFDHRGTPLGLRGTWPGSRESLVSAVGQAVQGPVNLCAGGSESVGALGIITGGAGSEVEKVAACGIDTFLTGEGPHWSFPLAQELGLNVLLAGHYATETFGVKAVAADLERRFALSSLFLHFPTGL